MSDGKGEPKKKGVRFLCFPHDQEEGVEKEKKEPRDHHPVLKSIATKMVKGSSLWCNGGGGEDDCIILVKKKMKEEEKTKEKKEKKKRKGWKRVRHALLITCRYIGMGVAHMAPTSTYPSDYYYVDPYSWYVPHGKEFNCPKAQPHWTTGLVLNGW